jgi:hypothetical protein
METRFKEHIRHFHLGQQERSVVAEHIMDTGHNMKFDNIHRLAKVKGYMYRVVKEATEIQFHPNNFNRDNGFILSKTLQPLFLQLHNNTANHNTDQAQQSSDSAH